MRRLIAIVVALAMVGAALLIRSAIDDNGGGGGGSNASDLKLLCASELADACDKLAQDTGISVDDSHSSGEVIANPALLKGFDGWLTFERSAEIVRQSRPGQPKILEASSSPIARTPLIVAMFQERAKVLAAACGGDVTWKCIGNQAGRSWTSIGGQPQWGNVKVAHTDPSTTGEGLAVISQATTQFFGKSDLDKLDFERDAFIAWFSRLEASASSALPDPSPFDNLIKSNSAIYDIVATTEAAADPILRARTDLREKVTVLYPSPVATLDAVYAPVVGGNGDL